jgi:hypothetical protein
VREDTTKRTATQLGILWSAGSANGGAPLLDYRVSSSADGAAYVILASGLTVGSFTATALTAGVTYTFVVQSRNRYTFSDYSTALPLLCATKPLATNAPTTSVSGNLAVISWP